MDYLLTTLTKKQEIDSIIRDTIDKVLVLRFGRASDAVCLQLDDILYKSVRDVSKFARIALVDTDSEDVQVYVKYFDITLIPSMVFFFNAHHMKMDSGSADHTKWIGSFHKKQDFIDVVETIFRGAMKEVLQRGRGRGGRSTSTATTAVEEEAEQLQNAGILTAAARTIHNTTARRSLGYFSCGTGNPIDDCWRCDARWQQHRTHLADCAIGFGRNAIGGRDGRFYVVTDPGDDDPVNPRPGTLRHAVIQQAPLWIIFKRDMVITLKQELIMNSFKTIDGRGVNVHIANGACITIQFVTNIIIHGLHIHDCKQTGNAMVRSSPSHYGWRTMADGDGISIFSSSHIWIDHNSLSSCSDGLIDAIMGSTSITISNNYFTNHNEVVLLGHSDTYARDRVMQVTVAYNHFGVGLIQRMPRCRHGHFHVVNNDYTHWEMYAIGGSASPTINSQGNRFLAPANPFAKEVTKRVVTGNGWRKWNWRSEGDLMLNGAYFRPSGLGAAASYARASSLAAKPSSLVGSLTSGAGVLACRMGSQC